MNKPKKTPALLTCESCRYFDRRANWCKAYASWRSRFTRRCAYGEMLAKKEESK